MLFSKNNSGLPDDTIYSLAEDKNGNIWIGTWGGGLAKFDGKTFSVFNSNNSPLLGNKIPSLAVDSSNTLWIGTVNGLCNLTDGVWNTFPDLPQSSVYSLCVTRKNKVYAGYKYSGLAIQQNKSWNILNTSNSGLKSSRIYSIVESKDENIWISVFGNGVAVLKDDKIKIFNPGNSPLHY